MTVDTEQKEIISLYDDFSGAQIAFKPLNPFEYSYKELKECYEESDLNKAKEAGFIFVGDNKPSHAVELEPAAFETKETVDYNQIRELLKVMNPISEQYIAHEVAFNTPVTVEISREKIL